MNFSLMEVLLIVSGSANLAWIIIVFLIKSFRKQVAGLANHLGELRKDLNVLTNAITKLNTCMENIDKRTTRLEEWKNGQK